MLTSSPVSGLLSGQKEVGTAADAIRSMCQQPLLSEPAFQELTAHSSQQTPMTPPNTAATCRPSAQPPPHLHACALSQHFAALKRNIPIHAQVPHRLAVRPRHQLCDGCACHKLRKGEAVREHNCQPAFKAEQWQAVLGARGSQQAMQGSPAAAQNKHKQARERSSLWRSAR